VPKLRLYEVAAQLRTGMSPTLLTSSPADWHHRVKELENQVSELESEAFRLSRALDAQKTNAHDLETSSGRKAEELAKELTTEVSGLSSCKQYIVPASDT
jgi:cell division septum initiation protein DivIVA